MNSFPWPPWGQISSKFYQCSTTATSLPLSETWPHSLQQDLDLGGLILGHSISALGVLALPYTCYSCMP